MHLPDHAPSLADLVREEAEAHGIVDETLEEPLSPEDEEMLPVDWEMLEAETASDRARLAVILASGMWAA